MSPFLLRREAQLSGKYGTVSSPPGHLSVYGTNAIFQSQDAKNLVRVQNPDLPRPHFRAEQGEITHVLCIDTGKLLDMLSPW
jgi:hypothetical protein